MSSEVKQDFAIRVSHLSKCYQIYDQPNDRLKQFIVPRIQRILGRTPRQYYREFWALKDVSFEIKKGETLGIIGRNGSGKSTLLQMICGTLYPTAGNIEINGRIAALLELGSGFNPEFSGRENVYLNAGVLGLTSQQTTERFADIEAFADIGEFIDQPVKTYSSGMMVRLAFAVIAHVDADILVVDEALAVGDAFFTQKCMRFLRAFMKEGTILFVSHDTSAILNFCDLVLWINHGQQQILGSAKPVIEQYLASVYQANSLPEITVPSLIIDEDKATQSDYEDFRAPLINSSNLRNDIQIFAFDPEMADFGAGGARIVLTRFLDINNQLLTSVIGGQDVVLEIICRAIQNILNPIVGFQFKDRLGQIVFADNTFLQYQSDVIRVDAGQVITVRFEFRLPVLPAGDYTISPAIAEGTQEQHLQHHWIHDALVLKVHASAVCFGVVGVPMRNITLLAS